jgi:hypothetical protein
MSGAYSTHGGDEKYIQNFGLETRKEGLGGDGRIILKWIISKLGESIWIGFIWLNVGTVSGLL